MKRLFALATILVSVAANATECEHLTPYGIPKVSGIKTTQICRNSYVVQYYDRCKVPLFAAEHLLGENVGGNEPRFQFRVDMSLPSSIRARNSDYVGTDYDKGHLAPAADFQDDRDAMKDSFILSNALPQTQRLNRGVWKSIEIRARAFAVKYKDVYVFSGGIFSNNPTIMGNGVCIPTHTYKIVIDKKSNQSIGWITPNNKTVFGKPSLFQVPVADVEKITGINFTPSLSKGVSEVMKSSIGNNLKVN